MRRAEEKDLPALMAIYEANVLAMKEMGIDQWQGEDRPTEKEIRRYLGRSLYLLEDEKKAVLGVVKLAPGPYLDYEKVPEIWAYAGPYACIGRLGILPEAKRQGLGSLIVETAEKEALGLGARSIRVDTHPGNDKMLGLLKKLGYEEAGIVYLRGTDKRIAFEKCLDIAQ